MSRMLTGYATSWLMNLVTGRIIPAGSVGSAEPENVLTEAEPEVENLRYTEEISMDKALKCTRQIQMISPVARKSKRVVPLDSSREHHSICLPGGTFSP